MVNADLLVFDMDGVLVDVSDSYRETIVQTVRHFTGRTIPRELVQEYKNQGGWNNDWALSQRIVLDLGVDAAYDTVVEEFNRLFLGHNGTEGLMARERWLPRPGMLEGLSQRFGLSIFSGRLHYEVEMTFERFGLSIPFDPIVCSEDVTLGKPHPEGLLRIMEAHPGKRLLYFGDVVDDAQAARAAGVPFVGVVAAGHSSRDEVLRLFEREQAAAVVENINEIEALLA